MDSKQCIFCKNDVEITRVQAFHSVFWFTCPICGHYFASRQVIHTLNKTTEINDLLLNCISDNICTHEADKQSFWLLDKNETSPKLNYEFEIKYVSEYDRMRIDHSQKPILLLKLLSSKLVNHDPFSAVAVSNKEMYKLKIRDKTELNKWLAKLVEDQLIELDPVGRLKVLVSENYDMGEKASLEYSLTTKAWEQLKHHTQTPKVINKLKAFISYSTKDKLVGAEIKKTLGRFAIDSFLAHDDIYISQEWKTRIIEELKSAQVFIPLLSNNFKNSEWTGQEIGVAYASGVPVIIPLKIDDTNPLGFINHIQGKKISPNNISLDFLIKPIIDKFPEVIISNVITELGNVKSCRYAEEVMSLLVPHFDRFQQKHIDSFVTHVINNRQVYMAWGCCSDYIPQFIERKKMQISAEQLKKLEFQIQHQAPYKD